MLDTFLEHADDEQANPWPIIGWIVGGIGLVLALIIGGEPLAAAPAAEGRGRPGR